MKTKKEPLVWEKKADYYIEQFERKLPHPSRSYLYNVIAEKKHENMLECGFGGADIPKYILSGKHPMIYTGLDCTPAFLARARELYPKPQFTFVKGDMENMKLKDNSFELVYTRHTLEHLEYYKKASEELARVSSDRVIIVLFHEFTAKDKIKYEGHKNRYLNYYKKEPFVAFMKTLFKKVDLYSTPKTDKWDKNIIVDCRL